MISHDRAPLSSGTDQIPAPIKKLRTRRVAANTRRYADYQGPEQNYFHHTRIRGDAKEIFTISFRSR